MGSALRDVNAVLPLILVLQVSHHLRPASRSKGAQGWPAASPSPAELPPFCSPSGDPRIAHCQKVSCRGCGSQPCSHASAQSSGRPCCEVVGQGAIVHHHGDTGTRAETRHRSSEGSPASARPQAPTTLTPGGCSHAEQGEVLSCSAGEQGYTLWSHRWGACPEDG